MSRKPELEGMCQIWGGRKLEVGEEGSGGLRKRVDLNGFWEGLREWGGVRYEPLAMEGIYGGFRGDTGQMGALSGEEGQIFQVGIG